MKGMGKIWTAGGLLFSLLLFSGCPIFLLGAGAAGGYAISKDEIEGNLDKSFDKVYQASRETLRHEGFIRKEDRPRGVLVAEIRKSRVKVEVKQITERTVRLRIKARKGYKLIPNLELANELYNKIIQKIK